MFSLCWTNLENILTFLHSAFYKSRSFFRSRQLLLKHSFTFSQEKSIRYSTIEEYA